MRRWYVDYSTALYLERASRYILGSQIDALNFLAANHNCATKKQLRPFYTAGAAGMPLAFSLYPFEQWLTFLTTWNLVSIDDVNVNLTAAGKAIVPYMQAWGYLNVRPPG